MKSKINCTILLYFTRRTFFSLINQCLDNYYQIKIKLLPCCTVQHSKFGMPRIGHLNNAPLRYQNFTPILSIGWEMAMAGGCSCSCNAACVRTVRAHRPVQPASHPIHQGITHSPVTTSQRRRPVVGWMHGVFMYSSTSY
jgi:hypothetical protein